MPLTQLSNYKQLKSKQGIKIHHISSIYAYITIISSKQPVLL